jgi:hypothetical protein
VVDTVSLQTPVGSEEIDILDVCYQVLATDSVAGG